MDSIDFVTHKRWGDIETIFIQLRGDLLDRAARARLPEEHQIYLGRLEGVERLWAYIQKRLEEIRKED